MFYLRFREKAARVVTRSLALVVCGMLPHAAACDGSGLSTVGPSADAASTTPAQTSADAAVSSPDLAPAGTPQQIGDYGLVSGGFSGYAWIAGGTGTTWISPNPCNDQGCFKNTGGMLCTSGSIAALTCTSPSACDWDTNWGTMIGWNPTTTEHEAWGANASSGLAVAYTGEPGEYRLMAHMAGDPDSKSYCVENYASGQVVTPELFLSQCWSSSGDILPSFAVADVFGLQLISSHAPIDFNICISSITLF
jgi:hypothetical protein